MRGVTIDGVKVSWPDKAPVPADSVLALVAPIPEKLWAATRHVVLASGENKDDAHWQEKYNDPNHLSVATGGDGTVCVYRGLTLAQSTFAHESGHGLAVQEWGTTFPPGDSPYGQAQRVEGPVSFYAQSSGSSAEDFAEAVRRYADPSEFWRQQFREKFPQKFAAVEAMLGPWQGQ
jgi:hypothetical protein